MTRALNHLTILPWSSIFNGSTKDRVHWTFSSYTTPFSTYTKQIFKLLCFFLSACAVFEEQSNIHNQQSFISILFFHTIAAIHKYSCLHLKVKQSELPNMIEDWVGSDKRYGQNLNRFCKSSYSKTLPNDILIIITVFCIYNVGLSHILVEYVGLKHVQNLPIDSLPVS